MRSSPKLLFTSMFLTGVLAMTGLTAIAQDTPVARPLRGGCVVWSYGTGNAGTGDGELFGPHTAEENPANPDEVLISEQYGHDILLLNRSTRELRVLYGKRGKAGSGELLNSPHSAHFIPDGEYEGHVLITELRGEHRVMILHRDTGEILWQYDELGSPLDAIYWDDDQIMVSDWHEGLFKIHLSDKEQLWSYHPDPESFPFYLQKLPQHYRGASYGGDLLVGYWGPHSAIRELDTENDSVVWEYGTARDHGRGDVYNKLFTSVRALRYGMNECNGGATIIVEERSRLYCVNSQKELVWDIGGMSPHNMTAGAAFPVLPTYVSPTRRGTLLVTDWGLNMIYEIDPFQIPERESKDAYLFYNAELGSDWTDSAVIESRGFLHKNIQVTNLDESAELKWKVLASMDAEHWQQINWNNHRLVEPGQAANAQIDTIWNFLKVQAAADEEGQDVNLNVYVSMAR